MSYIYYLADWFIVFHTEQSLSEAFPEFVRACTCSYITLYS
jgi:hypothetical protein